MEEDATKRFRYSLWPGQPLPVPPVLVWDAELRDGNVYYYTSGPDFRVVDLPPELYLREVRDLDLASDEQVVAFVRTYGMVGDAVGETGNRPSRLRLAAGHAGFMDYPEVRLSYLPGLLTKVIDISELITRKRVVGGHVQTLGMIRLHLRAIRDAIRLYQFLTGQLPYEDVVDFWQLPRVGGHLPPDDTDDVLRWLAMLVNDGLTPFHARIDLHPTDGDFSYFWLENV